MVEEFLRKRGVDYEVVSHQRAYTAQETAAVEHVSGYLFAKTVIVTDGDEFYMLVLPAPYRADLERAGEMIGAEVELASEDRVASLFPDCEVGAEPPFGSQFGIETYVDTSMQERDEIVFRAGSHQKTIKMSYSDWEEIEKPVVGSFAAGA